MTSAAALAREVFAATLAEIEVERVVRRSLACGGGHLTVAGTSYDLSPFQRVLVVAIGKAALPMARALRAVLDGRVAGLDGVAVTNERSGARPAGFDVLVGGHPIPDEGSLVAGREVLRRVRDADAADTLIVFAISGGTSALCECPAHLDLTLSDLRQMHRELVSCGAVIAEVNAVRSRVSAIKAGRLAAAAPRATQITLFASDVNPGDLFSIGSGPTVRPPSTAIDAEGVISRFGLRGRLPASVQHCFEAPVSEADFPTDAHHEVLIDNAIAVGVAEAVTSARFGIDAEVEKSLVEVPVEDLASHLVTRAAAASRPFCLISGGEAICPVRGAGRGGRNQETALRAARLLVELDGHDDIAILSAGTDGIDGNSPSAGAVADCTTITRAGAIGMDAEDYLERSDSYAFFSTLGDTLMTGPTGNNVRDLRIVVALRGAAD